MIFYITPQQKDITAEYKQHKASQYKIIFKRWINTKAQNLIQDRLL